MGQYAEIHVAKKTDAVTFVRQGANTLVLGSAGSGKSRVYTVPGIGQCGGSFIIQDTRGMLFRECAGKLKEAGYETRTLDLCDFTDGCFYNPFHYAKDDEDIQILVDCLMDNTDVHQEKDRDAVWWEAERNLLLAIFSYVYHEYKDNPGKQTMGKVMEILREISDETECSKITVPQWERFTELEKRKPDHAAVQYSRVFCRCTENLLKQVLISANVRMVDFLNEKVLSLMKKDTLHLEELPGRKQALFINNANWMNRASDAISAMLYTQAVKIISEGNQNKETDRVQIILDDFAGTGYLPDIDECMKEDNGICFSVGIQSLDQIYRRYGKEKGDAIMERFRNIVYMGTICAKDQEFITEALPHGIQGADGETKEELVQNLPDDKCIIISR